MRKALLLGLLVTPACMDSVETSSSTQAIVGGQTANPADFPSVVALEAKPGEWYCTGTLIAPEWILTAAHCVEGTPASDANVRFGDPDVNDEAGGTVVAAKDIYIPDAWDGDAWDNDIALVKLAAPITDRAPTPISRDLIAPATAVLDVGYGVADNNDMGGGLLRQVEKVTADCADANDPTVSGANLLCMDASDGRGSCFGDSGGPTFATIGGVRYVVGITSGGTGEACGAGWDLYTSVQAELAFIDAAMSGQLEPEKPTSEPDPTMPDPTMTAPTDDAGGCNAGGSTGGWLLVALGALVAHRRRG